VCARFTASRDRRHSDSMFATAVTFAPCSMACSVSDGARLAGPTRGAGRRGVRSFPKCSMGQFVDLLRLDPDAQLEWTGDAEVHSPWL
jgi:hypothetical protein